MSKCYIGIFDNVHSSEHYTSNRGTDIAPGHLASDMYPPPDIGPSLKRGVEQYSLPEKRGWTFAPPLKRVGGHFPLHKRMVIYTSIVRKNKAIGGKPCSCLCYFMDLGVRP